MLIIIFSSVKIGFYTISWVYWDHLGFHQLFYVMYLNFMMCSRKIEDRVSHICITICLRIDLHWNFQRFTIFVDNLRNTFDTIIIFIVDFIIYYLSCTLLIYTRLVIIFIMSCQEFYSSPFWGYPILAFHIRNFRQTFACI